MRSSDLQGRTNYNINLKYVWLLFTNTVTLADICGQSTTNRAQSKPRTEVALSAAYLEWDVFEVLCLFFGALGQE